MGDLSRPSVRGFRLRRCARRRWRYARFSADSWWLLGEVDCGRLTRKLAWSRNRLNRVPVRHSHRPSRVPGRAVKRLVDEATQTGGARASSGFNPHPRNLTALRREGGASSLSWACATPPKGSVQRCPGGVRLPSVGGGCE